MTRGDSKTGENEARRAFKREAMEICKCCKVRKALSDFTKPQTRISKKLLKTVTWLCKECNLRRVKTSQAKKKHRELFENTKEFYKINLNAFKRNGIFEIPFSGYCIRTGKIHVFKIVSVEVMRLELRELEVKSGIYIKLCDINISGIDKRDALEKSVSQVLAKLGIRLEKFQFEIE